MSTLDFSALRTPPEGCPSDYTLEALRRGTLDDGAADAARQHVAGCDRCAAHAETLAAGFQAFPELDERKVLAEVRRQLDRRPWWHRWLPALVLVGAAAAAIVLFVRPAPVTDPLPQVRTKGKATLRVFREGAAGSEEVRSGQPLAPGTRIKFGVDVPAAGAVRIVGLDAQGAYPAWPSDGGSRAMPAGKAQILPGASELDESPGAERLFLVHCPGQETAPECPITDQAPACPKPCTVSPFVIERAR